MSRLHTLPSVELHKNDLVELGYPLCFLDFMRKILTFRRPTAITDEVVTDSSEVPASLLSRARLHSVMVGLQD